MTDIDTLEAADLLTLRRSDAEAIVDMAGTDDWDDRLAAACRDALDQQEAT